MRFLRRPSALVVPLVCSLLLAATGCRSHVVSVRLVNDSAQPVSTIIVDYPSATFGVNSLEPGKSFQYRFKPSETGPLKIQFTNAAGVTHHMTGPTVAKDQEGRMEIRFTQDSAVAGTPAQ
jgi:hypothetical protein